MPAVSGTTAFHTKTAQPGAIGLLVRHRSMLWRTTLSDVRARFAGSALGLFWLVLYPLLFLGAYALVYLTIFKVRFELFDANEYVVLIFCGLIPFLGFAEALALGTPSVAASSNLIKNTLFPIGLVPVKSSLVAQMTQLVGMALLLIAVASVGRLSFWALLIPVIWVLQMAFTFGVLWILSALNVVLRDVQNLVSVAVLLLMMLSPIAYTAEMVPESVRPVLLLNPLSYLIECYRDLLMHNRFPDAGTIGILVGISMATFFAGWWFFERMQRVFSDHV